MILKASSPGDLRLEPEKPISIAAIPPGSIHAQCGFRQGDVWVSVDDVALTSPDKALAAYFVMKRAVTLRCGLLRRGQPIMIRIDLH